MSKGALLYLKDGIQQYMGEAYESACYALCLLDVAREYNEKYNHGYDFDVLYVLTQACTGTGKSSIIYYNENDLNDNDNFYVQHPDELLKLATGKNWLVEKTNDTAYKPSGKQFKINYYERVKTGSVIGHFERDIFKPYKNSLTVKYGTLKSLRICKVVYG